MRRREIITLLGGAAPGKNYMNTRRKLLFALERGCVSPQTLFARQELKKAARIGFLTRKIDASVSAQIDAFRQGLRDLGWVEGNNISIEYRDAEGQADRLRGLAAELVTLNVDVIVTVDTPPTQAAKQATGKIPIVIAVSADPVGAGLVASLGHPGGNVTGLSLLAPETDQKNPGISEADATETQASSDDFRSENQGMIIRLNAIQAAVPKLAIELRTIPAVSSNELAGALTAAARSPLTLSLCFLLYMQRIETRSWDS